MPGDQLRAQTDDGDESKLGQSFVHDDVNSDVR